MHMYPFFLQTPLPFRLPYNIEQSSLGYTVGPCWLLTSNIAVCTCLFQTPWLPLLPIFSPTLATINSFSKSVSLSYSPCFWSLWQFWGILLKYFGGCPWEFIWCISYDSIGIMGFGEEDQRGKVSFYQKYQLTRIISADNDLDHLPKEMFVRFCLSDILPLGFCLCILDSPEGSHYGLPRWLCLPRQEMQETQVWFPGWESHGEGNGNPFQCSCLENTMDRGAWRAAVHEVANSWTWLST